MRRAVPLVPIKILGPELAEWNNDPGYTRKQMVDSLITPGQRCDITGLDLNTGKPWIDYFSFHFYSGIDGDAASKPRDTIITRLRKSYGLAQTLAYLKNKISTSNLTHLRTANPVKIAVTEANIDFQTISNDTIGDVKCNSFIAGQYWAEMAAIGAENKVDFINYWSSAEGSMGYMKSNGTKKSTYHHFGLLGKYFKGQYCGGNSTDNKIKAFAAKSCNGINIFVMNQRNDTNIKFVRVNLDSSATGSTGNEVGIRIRAAGTKNIVESLGKEETLVIHCDACGRVTATSRYNKTKNLAGQSPLLQSSAGNPRSCGCGGAPNVNSTLRCASDTSNPHGIIPVTSAAPSIMYVADSIIVPAGVTFTIANSIVKFSAGAVIEIKPSGVGLPAGRLIIVNSTLQGCDGQTWAGIVANGRGDSAQIVIDSSSFFDAANVIQSKGSRNMSITNSAFYNGVSVLNLDSSMSFTISGNQFFGYTNIINTSRTLSGPSTISNNVMGDMTKGITCLNDNHSQLNISCNQFYNYSAYAVQSVNSTLKNQGTTSQGAGNTFYSSSSLLNNKFSHSGNNITYYTDPSNPFTLVTGIGMNATAVAAQNNGCSNSSARFIENEGTTKEQLSENKPGIISTIPNPNNGRAIIYFNLGKEKTNGEILVTNLFGQIVSRYPVNAASDKVEIDCSTFANGVYFTSLLVEGKIISIKKMMIAK